MPKLILYPRTPEARELVLRPGNNFAGRAPTNDIKIEDPSVSSRHCELVVNGDYLYVRDLGSTNGTFIDGARVLEGGLKPGHALRLGSVEIAVEAESSRQPTPELAPEPGSAEARAPVGSPPIPPPAFQPSNPAPPSPPKGLSIRVSRPAPVAAPEVPSSESAVAAVSDEPPVPPTAMAEAPAGKSNCRFHPKSPGRWLCRKCNNVYCDLCISTRPVKNVTGHFCRSCGTECVPVQVKVNVNPTREGEFFSLLPGSFAYPFKHGGAFLLVCGAIFFGVVGFLKAFSFYLTIIFYGYLFAYLQNVIVTTTHGDENEPSLPDVSNFTSDIIVPCFQLLGLFVFCFILAVAPGIYSLATGADVPWWVYLAGAIVGCLYFPMAFLAVAVFDSLGGASPMAVIPPITRLPLQYLVTCFLLAFIIAVTAVQSIFLPTLIQIPVVPGFVSGFITLYLFTVQCRLLGILYATNRAKFGWFRY